MPLKLAFRNLVSDPVRLVITLIGIGFAVVLLTVQFGLFVGFERMISAVIDHANANLWIMPRGTQAFDDAGLVEDRLRYRAIAAPDVKAVGRVIVQFCDWRKPDGNSATIVLIGIDPRSPILQPWGLVSGSTRDLQLANSVIVDRTYKEALGLSDADRIEIEGRRARVVGFTEGIRSFTTSPYVFTSIDSALVFTGISSDRSTYLMIRVNDGADIDRVKDELRSRGLDAEILTSREFSTRCRNYWILSTGAGAALIGGAILGLLVGCTVVAQTLYASTLDHLREFATLYALGSPGWYLYQVILIQAAMSAVAGYVLGMTISVGASTVSHNDAIPITITPATAIAILGITLIMCGVGAATSISKVLRLDPAIAFGA